MAKEQIKNELFSIVSCFMTNPLLWSVISTTQNFDVSKQNHQQTLVKINSSPKIQKNAQACLKRHLLK